MARQVSSSTLGAPSDTYFFSIAEQDGLHSVIASDDSLRVFTVGNLNQVRTFEKCTNGVTCLTSEQSRTFVAGRDGSIRGFDIRTATQGTLISKYEKAGISALACKGNFVAAGTESTKEGLGDVDVLVYDLRNATVPVRIYAESHTDTITDLSWHSAQPGLLMSGSTDGLVSIFDVEQTDEEDALKQVLNPKSAVHCSGFIADDEAYVLSTDEQFFIYGLNKTGTADDAALPFKELGDLRPKLDCSYVVNLSQSYSKTPVLAHGDLEKQRLALTILTQPDYEFKQTIELTGAHGGEVVRDFKFFNERTAVSCGEDGHVRVWDLQSLLDAGSSESMEVDSNLPDKKKSSKKDKKTRNKDKGHFAPY